MKYKVLYHEPKNLIDYAKWINHQFEDHELELLAVNGFYHIFTGLYKKEVEDEQENQGSLKRISTKSKL